MSVWFISNQHFFKQIPFQDYILAFGDAKQKILKLENTMFKNIFLLLIHDWDLILFLERV